MAAAYGIRFSFLYRAKMRGRMLYEVIIEERGFTGVPEILKPCDDVLTIRQGTKDDSPFVPIKGSEATIKVLCCNNMQYLSLFTTDAHKYRVSVFEYRRGAKRTETPTLIWRGFIDANSYTEKFARPPYVVTIKAVDGLAELNNYPLKDADNNPLEGLIRARTLLDMCLAKLDIDLPVSEWIGAHRVTWSVDTLGEMSYEASDIYQANPNATFADALRLCLPYGSQIFQANGTIHIRRTASLISLTRPDAYTSSHSAIGIRRMPVIPLWEGGCDISSDAEFKVLPPIHSTVAKLTADAKKDLTKWFGLYKLPAWKDFANRARVFADCVQVSDVGLGNKIKFSHVIEGAKYGGMKIKFDTANLCMADAHISAALRVECYANSVSHPSTLSWMPTLGEWRDMSASLDRSMYIYKVIEASKKENLNLFKRSNPANFNSDTFEFAPTYIPDKSLLYIDFICGSGGAEPSAWVWEYVQIYNIEITMTGDHANAIIAEKTDAVNGGYTDNLKAEAYASESTYVPNSDLYYKMVMRDQGGESLYHTLTPHSGTDTFETIFADARALREGVAYSITGELRCGTPVDINTLFIDKKYTKRVYYVNYIERIIHRDIYDVQLTQLIDTTTHELFTGKFKEMTTHDQYSVTEVFSARTALFFKADNRLYKMNIEGVATQILHATELHVWQSGECVTVGYKTPDNKEYLAAYSATGEVINKILNPVSFIGAGIADKVAYDTASGRWSSAKILNGDLVVTLFESNYAILDTRTFTGKWIVSVEFIPCGFIATTMVDNVLKSYYHNYSIHADGEVEDVIISNTSSRCAVLSTNGYFFVCRAIGDTATSLCVRGGKYMSVYRRATVAGALNATTSARYMATNDAATIYVFDVYKGTTLQIPIPTNITIRNIILIGNVLYAAVGDQMDFLSLRKYCIQDDTVLGDASAYTFELIPSDVSQVAPASGAEYTITATLNIYADGILVSSEVVTPTLTGSASGFRIQGNTVTAEYRGTTVGVKRSISILVSHTFTRNGQTLTLSADTTISQAANTKQYVSFTPSNRNRELPAAGGAVNLYGCANYAYTSKETSTVEVAATKYSDVMLPAGWSISTDCKLTATNRGTTQGAAISGKLTVGYHDMEITNCYLLTVHQEANEVTGYLAPLIRSFTVADIPAAGGTRSSGVVNYIQSSIYTSGANGTADTSAAQVAYSTPRTAPSLGTTLRARTSVGTLSVTVTSNGKSSSKFVDVWQQANELTGYLAPDILSFTAADIPAAGGSVASGAVGYLQSSVYTSGATGSADTSAAQVTYSAPITALSLGTTLRARTSVGTLSVTVASNGKSSSKAVDVWQQANEVTGYLAPLIRSFTVADIPAAGGTRSSGTLFYLQSNVYTSGANGTADTSAAQATYSAPITAPSLGTTLRARTSVGTLSVTVTSNGKSSSKAVGVCQQANELTGYLAPDILSFAVVDIPAAGGSVASGVVSYLQSSVYTSGANGIADTSAAQVTYSAPITALSLGTTLRARTSVGTLSVTVASNGKSSSKAVDVWQQANTRFSTDMRVLATPPYIAAVGGTSRLTSTMSWQYDTGDSSTENITSIVLFRDMYPSDGMSLSGDVVTATANNGSNTVGRTMDVEATATINGEKYNGYGIVNQSGTANIYARVGKTVLEGNQTIALPAGEYTIEVGYIGKETAKETLIVSGRGVAYNVWRGTFTVTAATNGSLVAEGICPGRPQYTLGIIYKL